jgi:hypothetical protein
MSEQLAKDHAHRRDNAQAGLDNASFSGRRGGLVTSAAILGAALLAPSASAEILNLQRRSPPDNNPNNPGFSTSYSVDGVFEGFGVTPRSNGLPGVVPPRYLMFQETFAPEMAGQAATLTLPVTLNINEFNRRLTASEATGAGSPYRNIAWGLQINFYTPASFNPLDVTQGIVSSIRLDSTSAPLSHVGRTGTQFTASDVLRLSYEFAAPDTAGTYLIAISGAPTNIPTSVGGFQNFSMSYGFTTVSRTFASGVEAEDLRITQQAGDDVTVPFNLLRPAGFTLDVAVVPTPSSAALLGLAGLAFSSRRRR